MRQLYPQSKLKALTHTHTHKMLISKGFFLCLFFILFSSFLIHHFNAFVAHRVSLGCVYACVCVCVFFALIFCYLSFVQGGRKEPNEQQWMGNSNCSCSLSALFKHFQSTLFHRLVFWVLIRYNSTATGILNTKNCIFHPTLSFEPFHADHIYDPMWN